MLKKQLTAKQKEEVKELMEEFKINEAVATHAYREMVENFELTEIEAISSYWLERGEEPPKEFGGQDTRKPRATVQEIKERDKKKLLAQEIKRQKDQTKQELEIDMLEWLTEKFGEAEKIKNGEISITDENGHKFTVKIIAKR